MKRDFYAIYDCDASKPGCIQITPEEALDLNQRGWGIFWTVNEFSGPRKKENLVRVNSWAIDMDTGGKNEQWTRIKRGLVPSRVVETKRGFHVYFDAKNGTAENWNAIVSDRLVPFYQADPNAKDLARILRVPGFYHSKNLLSRFEIKTVFEKAVSYSEADMLHFYPLGADKAKELERKREFRSELSHCGDDLWERIWSLDCRDALERLSGTVHVNGEVYTFKPVSRGHQNIYVDGRGTSCFIDEHGRIGSLSKGGPTIWNWLAWYGHPKPAVYRIIQAVFPELFVDLKDTREK